MGGLAPTVTDEDFREYFGQYGPIVESVVMTDRETQRSRGFGFITFESHHPVDDIMKKRDHSLKEKVVEVRLDKIGTVIRLQIFFLHQDILGHGQTHKLTYASSIQVKKAYPKGTGQANERGGGPMRGSGPGYGREMRGGHQGRGDMRGGGGGGPGGMDGWGTAAVCVLSFLCWSCIRCVHALREVVCMPKDLVVVCGLLRW